MDNQQALELLKESVRVNTVLGNEKELADKLEAVLKEYGLETEQVEYAEGRNQLIVTYKGNEEGPVLAFSGHLDVVPIGEVDWEDDPFAAVEKDGKLYGRGTCDMKSGVISAIVALIRLKESGKAIKGTLKLIITMGEETSSIGAKQLVEEGYADDVDAMIINEPTNLDVGLAHKGALWPRITTYGKTAHGSMPHEGVNAIQNLIKIANRFEEKFDFTQQTDDVLGHSTSSLNTITGGSGTNVVPDQATLEFDIRTVASQDHEEIKADIESMLKELEQEDETFDYKVEYINDLVAIKRKESDPFVHVVTNSVREVMEKDAAISNPSYYTDGSKFVLADKDFPIIIIGPGRAELAHQPNEFVDIQNFYDMIDINQQIAEKYLA